jgi:DNA-binding NarL/FixJ family response regulator
MSPGDFFKPISKRSPIVYVYCKHPLARKEIERALSLDSSLRGSVLPLPHPASSLEKGDRPLVIVFDICSVEDWPELVPKWISLGTSPVALLPAEGSTPADQLRVLYLGALGIVVLSADLEKELPMAVHSVASGRLWISRGTLNEYVRQNNLIATRLLSENQRFTAREEQVVKFIIRGFSNKQIGSLLTISERTVKFHVSNILQKAKAQNREELLQRLAPC